MGGESVFHLYQTSLKSLLQDSVMNQIAGKHLEIYISSDIFQVFQGSTTCISQKNSKEVSRNPKSFKKNLSFRFFPESPVEKKWWYLKLIISLIILYIKEPKELKNSTCHSHSPQLLCSTVWHCFYPQHLLWY